MALFIGEFGVPESYKGNKEAKFREYVDAIKNYNIQLSALWVYDPLGGANGYMKDWAVTPQVRAYQFAGLKEINSYFEKK